eukprot:c21413_g1_i1 orf=381-1244(-)
MAQEGCKVLLNVYDLSQGLARQLSTTFLGKAIDGIWHTGIVVFGNEYYFGGGIQSCPEGQTPYGRPMKVVDLGYTEVPKEVFEDYLQDISPRYTAQTYSLLQHNCNNFSDEVSQFLCGVGIPDFILKLPEEVMNSPMGALIMPMIQQFETTLRYGGVPQVPHAGSIQLANLSQMPASSALPSSPANGNGSVSQRLPSTGAGSASALLGASAPLQLGSEKKAEKTADTKTSIVPDKLGEARARVQEEITREFAALMAEGRLRASEAAALATRKVMERHGRGAGLASQS